MLEAPHVNVCLICKRRLLASDTSQILVHLGGYYRFLGCVSQQPCETVLMDGCVGNTSSSVCLRERFMGVSLSGVALCQR